MHWWFGRRLAVLLIVLAAPALAAAQGKPSGAPPPAVVVAPVSVQNVAPKHAFIGHVQAIKSVQLMARVTAFLEAVKFQEGAQVKQGEVLFQLQKAPYEAAVHAAQAQLAKAQANYAQAKVAYQRAQRLNKHGFEAQANLDQARATRDADAADVEAAKANLATAAINLSYCTITAPIAGRIGASTYDVGTLITPNSKPLATINQMDPIRVAFAVPDRQLLTVQQTVGQGARQIAQQLTVSLQLANGAAYGHQGKISFINNAVDPSTGTVTVWADFANPNGLLVPGAFATVQVRRTTPEKKPMVPVAAAQTDQKGSYVLTVGPDDKVKQQPVTLGRQVAQSFIVNQGLTGGERVIVQGMQKVRPGEVVKPVRQSVHQPGQATAQDATTRQGG